MVDRPAWCRDEDPDHGRRHSLADVSQAVAALGYRPLVEFGEGLARTVGFYE
jgi:nucleoside-diphosphate-sugar epimerase